MFNCPNCQTELPDRQALLRNANRDVPCPHCAARIGWRYNSRMAAMLVLVVAGTALLAMSASTLPAVGLLSAALLLVGASVWLGWTGLRLVVVTPPA
ncbi:hypothetical protein [uncultured Maricaulis sp.]|uniref:hypothetical protein n=1 Tax=uncultured Maricaulis sp. TaxID=174710 RepID=UPI00261BB4C8|nr:hypothetical protein [uncultured Maricaulis sp.]